MRFRRIEKDALGATTEIMQGKEDDVSVSESKTYIGSSTKKKVDMNKIKNTKIGDDIHYYVNGVEGRGIVVKMGSQYLDLFQQDGNVKTININDTFFVKDILLNKQWDDMDDVERYDALQKIHAPTPRYIIKSWGALPDEIKDLLRKDGIASGASSGGSGGSGFTYEAGETKDSETQDHARTGFAQNSQYKKNKNTEEARAKETERDAKGAARERHRKLDEAGAAKQRQDKLHEGAPKGAKGVIVHRDGRKEYITGDRDPEAVRRGMKEHQRLGEKYGQEGLPPYKQTEDKPTKDVDKAYEVWLQRRKANRGEQ